MALPQEPIKECVVEQIVATSVPQVWEKIVVLFQPVPQERILDRVGEKIWENNAEMNQPVLLDAHAKNELVCAANIWEHGGSDSACAS